MDGANPKASLIWDAAGNLYGTTANGGVYRAGTVFEMTPRAEGGWTEKVLHNFGSNGDGHSGVDGRYPQVSLIWDAAGNLYGTTQWGGTHDDNGTCYQLGCGTVFELTPRQGAGWTEKVLHNFGSGMDGVHPWASLIWDAAGNLYGTTSEGGTHGPHGPGTVFELSPQSGGGWTEKVVHNFDGDDGGDPFAGLIFDAAGNLYGTTEAGGDYYAGTVFELTPNGSGGWTEKVLHNFGSGMDGADPNASLIWDAAGNLYGTTTQGGTHGGGTVYEITP